MGGLDDYPKGALTWILPGEGESGLTCGLYRWRYLCTSEAIAWRRRDSCRRLECRHCWPDAVRAEAARATKRLLAGWEVLGTGDMRHSIVSWPLDQQPETREALEEELARVRELLAEEEWLGYTLVIHPFRARCACCARDLASGEPPCRESTKVYDRPGFHVHILGVKEFHQGNADWGELMYKNQPLRTSGPIEEKLFRTLEYELSHAGRPSRRAHSLRWCGAFSYSKLKTEEDKPTGEAAPRCPSCDGELEPVSWQAQDGTLVNVGDIHGGHFSGRDWPEKPPPGQSV